jgi:hypothetical protein
MTVVYEKSVWQQSDQLRMKQIMFFEVGNKTLVFTQFPDEEGLPFPLYLPMHWKLAISIPLLVLI